MERLTKRISNGKIGYALLGPGECVDVIDLLHVWGDRLAAYEDTGLEPEEITTEPYGCVFYCNRKCNLDGDFCAEGPGCPYEINAEAAKHLLELAQAEKDGRIMEYMPGDKVYDRFGKPWIVESSEIHLMGEKIEHLYRCGHPGTDDYCALGEEEILTCEEAEAALKKREEGEN